MKSYIKLILIFLGVWLFAWLAGSFGNANLNISEWSSESRGFCAMIASFFCALIIPVVFTK